MKEGGFGWGRSVREGVVYAESLPLVDAEGVVWQDLDLGYIRKCTDIG